LGKTWDDPEGEEKKNNEQAMPRGLGGNPHSRKAWLTMMIEERCSAVLGETPTRAKHG